MSLLAYGFKAVGRLKGVKLAVGTKRRRLRSEERKQQILQVALRTIAERGVHGTTVGRIADSIGVTHSALYAHFPNRQGILLAALDTIFEEIYAIHEASRRDDAVEHLREIMRHHTTALTAPKQPSYAVPLFEFIAHRSDEALGEALKKKEVEATRHLAEIIDEAKRQGRVKQSVESEQAAWMLVACAWAEETAYLMDIKVFQEESLAPRMADLILDSIIIY